MFADIQKLHMSCLLQIQTTSELAAQISSQSSENVGHLTGGVNWADADCSATYDKYSVYNNNPCFPYSS